MAHGADAEALAQIESEFQGNSLGGAEIRSRRKDGGEFWAAIFISLVRDEEGNIVQYFASFVDLTKHKGDQAQSRMLIQSAEPRDGACLSNEGSVLSGLGLQDRVQMRFTKKTII